MRSDCCAEVNAEGLAVCDGCGRMFDPVFAHLEFFDGALRVGLVVCAQCVPELLELAEREGPPGAADCIREVWLS